MADRPFVFVSYARSDREKVREIVEELRRLDLDLWVDADDLVAGLSWANSIEDALRRASAVLTFISPYSMQSEWVRTEIAHALQSGVHVLPVLLQETVLPFFPPGLQDIQQLDARKLSPKSAAIKIKDALKRWSAEVPESAQKEIQNEDLAKAFAAQSKGDESAGPEDRPRSVFIVHGHDEKMLRDVVDFVEGHSIEAVVLKNMGGADRSLLQKFFDFADRARFAIVLLSADDMGASRVQFDQPSVGERALKYRSRQNVILELGYFYGSLGWDRVFVLEKKPPLSFPDFERPSDLNGVLFDRLDENGKWKSVIARRLVDSGFVLKQTSGLASA